MATKLITVPRAQAEISRLQQYITLVEEYQADTLESRSMNTRTALEKL
jgi:hypothetical protein